MADDDLDDDPEENPPPPRNLRGRKARKIWRDLAPSLAIGGRYNAGSAQLLSVLCTLLAELGDEPDAANHNDIRQARAIGKSLGLFL